MKIQRLQITFILLARLVTVIGAVLLIGNLYWWLKIDLPEFKPVANINLAGGILSYCVLLVVLFIQKIKDKNPRT